MAQTIASIAPGQSGKIHLKQSGWYSLLRIVLNRLAFPVKKSWKQLSEQKMELVFCTEPFFDVDAA